MMEIRWIAVLLIVAGLGAAAWGAPAFDPLTAGIAQYQAGNYPQALSFFLRAVELRPTDPPSWIWLAATHLKLNQPSDAVLALRRALTLDPHNGPAYLFLGFAYSRLGQRQFAQQAFELALQYAPTPEYAAAAREWLQSLRDGSPPVSLPPPPPAACPSPPRLPVAKAPPQVPDRRERIEFSDFEAALEGETLRLTGLVVNVGEIPIRNIRARLTMFGVTGQVVFESTIAVDDELESGDGKEFSVRMPTALPPLWGRLAVVDLPGRSGREPPDVATFAISLDVYKDLAKRRVKIGSRITPAGASTRHVVCVWIADSAGFPISEARIRLRVTPAGAGEAVPPARTLLVGRDEVVSLELTWLRPTTAVVTADVERVELSALP